MPDFTVNSSKLNQVATELTKVGIGTILGLIIPGAGMITKLIDLAKKKRKQNDIEEAKKQINEIIMGSFYKVLDEDLAIAKIKIKKVRNTKNVFS